MPQERQEAGFDILRQTNKNESALRQTGRSSEVVALSRTSITGGALTGGGGLVVDSPVIGISVPLAVSCDLPLSNFSPRSDVVHGENLAARHHLHARPVTAKEPLAELYRFF